MSGVFPLLSRIVMIFSIFRVVLKGLLSLLSLVQVFMMFVLSGVPLRAHVFVVNVHYKFSMLESLNSYLCKCLCMIYCIYDILYLCDTYN